MTDARTDPPKADSYFIEADGLDIFLDRLPKVGEVCELVCIGIADGIVTFRLRVREKS